MDPDFPKDTMVRVSCLEEDEYKGVSEFKGIMATCITEIEKGISVTSGTVIGFRKTDDNNKVDIFTNKGQTLSIDLVNCPQQNMKPQDILLRIHKMVRTTRRYVASLLVLANQDQVDSKQTTLQSNASRLDRGTLSHQCS